jgi:nucleotide-binding universal stress UspA family protein
LTTPVLHWIYPARILQAEARAAEARRAFSVLVPVALPENGPALARLAATLVDPPDAGGKLFALHLKRPADHEAYRTGLEEIETAHTLALAPLLAEAKTHKTAVEPVSFVTRDVAADIAAVAAANQVGLIIMGFHKPVFGKTILGGTVHRVMTQCDTDVAVFVDRGFASARRILVPFLGSAHDRLSMQLAARIARNTGAEVTVLHVVPAARDGSPTDAKTVVSRAFDDPAAAKKVALRVIEERSPVAAVLREAKDFDLVIIGVSERWGLESHLFGWRPERIARESPTSLLIVRRHETRSSSASEPVAAPQPATLSS